MTDVELVLTAPAPGAEPDAEVLRTWLEALARVPGGRRRLVDRTGGALPERSAALAADLGIDVGDAGTADLTFLARWGDLPSPRALVVLAAAAGSPGALAAAHPWPGTDGTLCVAVRSPAPVTVLSAPGPAEAVAAAGAGVVRQPGALVVPAGGATPQPQSDEPQPAYGHPAALPATLLHRMLQQTGLPVPQPVDASARPLLTVVTRTQGTRLLCLEEALTSLAAQSCRDMEVVVAAHRVPSDRLAGIRDSIATLPAWLRERLRIVEVERAGRSAPLNDALATARGRYVAVLDDDDLVTPDWVATFARLERTAPGTVLRAATLRQDVVPTEVEVVGRTEVVGAARGTAHLGWPDDFSMVDHLVDNATPVMALALPRGVVVDLGERFDEDLETTEDWDLLLRAAGVAGVTSSTEATSVYRLWQHGEGSRSTHERDTWERGHRRVRERLAERVLLLRGAESERLAAARAALAAEVAEKHRIAELNEKAAADLVAVNEAVVVLRAQLAESEEKRQRAVERARRLRARLDETTD